MYICRDASGRYTISMYWYRREFYIVTKEIAENGQINQIDAARYPKTLAESLMTSILAGQIRVEGLEFEQRVAYAIAGRIAEGLESSSEVPPEQVCRKVRWN